MCEKMGQGRESAKQYLRGAEKPALEVEKEIKEKVSELKSHKKRKL